MLKIDYAEKLAIQYAIDKFGFYDENIKEHKRYYQVQMTASMQVRTIANIKNLLK